MELLLQANIATSSLLLLVITIICGVVVSYTFFGRTLKLSKLLPMLLSFIHTIAILISLPMYILLSLLGYQYAANIAIAVLYSLVLLEYPPILLHPIKIPSATHSFISHSIYTVVKENPKVANNMFRKAWYIMLASTNSLALLESMYTGNMVNALMNLLYLNSILSMLVARFMLIIWYMPSMAKKMQKYIYYEESHETNENELNSLIKRSEGAAIIQERKKSYYHCVGIAFNIWNLICFTFFFMTTIYYLVGLNSPLLQAILQKANMHLLLFLYITLCISNGAAVVSKVVNSEFIWKTKKKRIFQVHVALYGLKVIGVSLAWIVVTAINGVTDMSTLGGIIDPHSWVECLLSGLNIVTVVILFTNIFYSYVKQRKQPKAEEITDTF